MNKFHLKIVNKQLTFSSETHKSLFSEFLKQNEGKIITVEKYVPIRSNQQNRFYWMFLGMIESETGNLSNSMHEEFRRTLLPPEFIKGIKGNEIKIARSTTTLTKIEFGEYLDKISALTGVAIPTEEDMEKMGFISNTKRYHD